MTLILILFLLCLSAFFSGSETALTATSRARIRTLELKGSRPAAAVLKLTEDKERLIGAILLGNNLVNILASALATSFLASIFPGGLGVALATAVMTILVLVFAEVMPKTAAISRPDRFAMAVAVPMQVLVRLFAPVTAVVQAVVRVTLSTLGVDVSNTHVLSPHEELKGAVDLHHEEGQMEKEARDIIRGALELDDITVEEIMIHRKNIEMLDVDQPNRDIVEAVLQSKFTRIPLYKDNPDDIIGVLHAKDLLRALWAHENDPDRISIRELAMEAYFVPETTTLQEQLDAFKATRQHFAMIIDEYGSIQGLVTLEDILEEIVGEIEDEYDAPIIGVKRQADRSVIVDGTVTIRDLNRMMDWRLPDEEAVTIAGLVIHEGRCIPDVGQIFSFFGYRFEVLKKRRNQVTSLRVVPLDAVKR
ncbi:CBS domain protein [Parvularcula bermudensis HTCC2503]|uniref:CBS domain protein n=1 Tax=Parvularcula bermudensis (strain ATCC BAA-594 / HTCC2503 / KCTC 12087) TaxID=314260 RepID=E0TB45_PARBH|nr:HlyC/CorC family transporter [Parvularcula bermudensis]ADM08254.1 CBS domain protein [Parvularcula bermudensis HTCC2503]